ncbi:hypothetical protein [Gemmobacter sp. 24YEA27]|uniref:hypothetical protein n=1 Tax=Gemmobacter sp. 24YEA27 TaxID=3040672 RepID=UPI0024B38BAA|nr:hypothetical protein [Gemmobacter sp. 24YEA27]
MDPIVSDANRRFEFSKALLDRAKKASDPETEKSFSEMAIAAAFSCLEGMLTHIFEHFIESKGFDVFEQSIMQEKAVKLVRGRPCLSEQRFQSIDDRLQYLFWRFSGEDFDRGKAWWPNFANAVNIRNGIMHPKKEGMVKSRDAEQAVLAIIDALDDLMLTVFGTKWPKANKGIVPSFEI